MRRDLAALLLGSIAACASPGDAPRADPGADFDAACAFLVAGMESYRFDRFVEKTTGRVAIRVQCGRRFRCIPDSFGQGDAECIEVIDNGTCEQLLEADPAFGEIVARPSGTVVRHMPAQTRSLMSSRACWTAVVDRRFIVSASRVELIRAALSRTGRRDQLIATLRLPVKPSWRSDLTIVRRFPRERGDDYTNPWSVKGESEADVRGTWVPPVALQTEIAGHLVESSQEDAGTLRLTIVTTTPDAAAEYYRAFCFRPEAKMPRLVLDGVDGEVARLHADFTASHYLVVCLDHLFGWNWVI